MDRIWAVDDDLVYHFVINRFFQELGIAHTLRLFKTSSQLLEAAKIANKEDVPDLLLLDLRMPDLDGWQLITELSDVPLFSNTVPIVIISSSIDPADVMRAKDIPMVRRYIPKPITLQNIASALEE